MTDSDDRNRSAGHEPDASPGDPPYFGDGDARSAGEGVEPAPDGTLAGYFREHDRPPGFDGIDGQPYTVSLETERTPDLRSPIEGFLVFPRWAESGLGVVGHVESPTLTKGRTREEVLEKLGSLTLVQVKEILDLALRRRAELQHDDGGPGPPLQEG